MTYRNTNIIKLSLAPLFLAVATAACGGPVEEESEFKDESLTTKTAAASGIADPLQKSAVDTRSPVADPGTRPAAPLEELAMPTQDGPVAKGVGWSKYSVSGSFQDIDANVVNVIANRSVVVVQGMTGLQSAPLSANTRLALQNDVTASRSLARSADLAKSSDLARAPDDADMVYFVDQATSDGLGMAAKSGVSALSAECSDYTKDYPMQKSYAKTPDPYSESWTAGDFVGTLKASASTSGSATATLRLKVKRGSIFGRCFAYAVGFQNVRLTATAQATAELEASGNFRKPNWQYTKLLAKPEIATFPFMIGPVPVLVGLNVPVEVGVNASASATASIKGKAQANGKFDYTCTTSGCTGTRSFSAGFTPDGEPQFLASGRAKIQPWVQGSLRVYLYSDELVYAQVGVRPSVQLDLFSYVGKGCGDAFKQGADDDVVGSSLDSSLHVELTAKAFAFGKDWNMTPYDVYSKHLGFWKVGGKLPPWAPVLTRNGVDSYDGSMIATARTCWPYKDAITTTLAWGDGGTESAVVTPGTQTKLSHHFPGKGNYPITGTFTTDAQGRTLGGSATSNLNITGVPNLAIGSGTSGVLSN